VIFTTIACHVKDFLGVQSFFCAKSEHPSSYRAAYALRYEKMTSCTENRRHGVFNVRTSARLGAPLRDERGALQPPWFDRQERG
jgi:hypothetical protein